jgi:hypothetical protein
MGCWNGTDLITQLPIMYGDEVVLIPLKVRSHIEKLTGENPCYSNAYFKPLPILLYGEYDDYGCINGITGDIEQFKEIVQKESKLEHREILEKVNRYGSDNQTDIEYYVRFIERGNIEKVGYVLIHKELFDKLKDFDDFWEGKAKYVEEYYNSITFKKRLNEAREQGATKDELFEMSMNSGFGSWETFDRISLNDINKDSISAILSISSVLGITRKYWFPQTGAGGQVQIEKPHRIIQEFYNKFIEEYDKEEDEEE